ncbi:MAG: glucosaminidase domain-containing protein [Bacteroidota bacterium]
MSRVNTYYVFIFLLNFIFCMAQPSERKNTPEDYIAKFKEEAIAQMQTHKIPASITLAQGMLESGNGNSALAVYANNHFGIKCHNDWDGETYYADDDAKDECFRKYQSVLDSYNDHSIFLTKKGRYSFLFELKRDDYKGWAYGLKKAGYATHKSYAEMLIELIEKHKLYELDKLTDIPVIVSDNVRVTGLKMELRTVVRFNRSRFIIAKKGDSFMKIAQDFNVEVEDLLKYNDFDSKSKIKPGEKIYIVKKRRKGIEPVHIVQRGETMHSISQLHGIRLYWLYKRNKIKQGVEPTPGQVLILKRGGKRSIIEQGVPAN